MQKEEKEDAAKGTTTPEIDGQGKILCVIDGSYMEYYTIFSAVRKFQTLYPDKAAELIKPEEETDQDNLPDLLVSPFFVKVLKDTFLMKCQTVDGILMSVLSGELLDTFDVDFLFALDSGLRKSFRKASYPEYKANRKLTKHSYNVFAIKDYVERVLFPELNIHGRFGYNLLRVEGAEGDDVIACVLKNFQGYREKILLASDHDFCQLAGVQQYSLNGDRVLPTIKTKRETITMTPEQAKLVKIVSGDSSDNIPSIARGLGPVRAFRLVEDKGALRQFLAEHQSAAEQFVVNRGLIDFDLIPEDLECEIVDAAAGLLSVSCLRRKEQDGLLTGGGIVLGRKQ